MADGILSAWDADQGPQAAAQANLGQAWKLNPDQQARAQAVAKAAGVAPSTGAAQFDVLSAWDKTQQAAGVLATAPKTTGWLAHPQEGANNAAVSHDEVGLLGNIEKLARQAFALSLTPDRWKAALAEGAYRGLAIPLLHGAGAGADAAASQITGTPQTGVSDALGPSLSFARQVTQAIRNKNPNSAEQGLEKGSELLSALAPALVNPWLGAVTFALEGASNAADDAAEHGAKPGSNASDRAVLENATIQGVLGLLPFEAVAGKFLPTVSNPALAALQRFSVAGASSLAIGGAMQAGENLSAKLNFDPKRDLGEGVLESAAQMGALGLIAHGLIHLPKHVDAAAGEAAKAHTSEGAIQNFDQAVEAVRASKTVQRSPERFQTLMQDVAPEGRVYVPAETVATYLQKLSPEEQAKFAEASGIADQLEPALAGKGDVIFPADRYLARVAPTEAHDAFKEDYRLTLEGMSKRELSGFDEAYKAFLKSHAEGLTEEAQASQAAAEPARRVYADIFAQAREAGFPIDVSSQYAGLYAARYETRAQRFGTDAWQEYQRAGTGMGVRLRQEFPALAAEFDRLDVALEALRKRQSGEQKRGPSLLEFLAKEGGLAPHGDLEAMDAGKFRKPFTPKLVREGGLNLEQAAEKAQEAGYFPDFVEQDQHGRGGVTEAHLLEAIRKELSGEQRFAVPLDERRADFRHALDELEQFLHTTGVPLETSNDTIRAALEAHLRAPEGVTYEQVQPPAELVALTQKARELRERRNRASNAQEWEAAHAELLPVADKLAKMTGSPLGLDSEEVAKGYAGGLDEFKPDEGLIASAVKEFGVTRDPRAAGYILPDGRMLDLSEEGFDGSRTQDHRAVAALDGIEASGTAGMTEFMNRTGAVRVDFQAGLFEAQRVPTPRAVRTAVTEARKMGRGLLLEATRPDGSPKASEDLARPTAEAVQAFFEREAAGRTFYQADGSAMPRGSIAFSDGPALISLYQQRDLSTFLHESGHLFLEELQADAAHPDAPEQVKADWEVVKKALGIGEGEIPVEAHETWARSFEHYLMEGRAPSEGLRGAFQRFRSWLVNIYKTLTALNVHVSDELRGVFDRLLATDEEIAHAQQMNGFTPADPKALGMTDAQAKAYGEAVIRAREKASDDLLAKVMRDVRRQRTAEWKDELARVKDELAPQVDQRPDVQAYQALTRGTEALGKVRLSADAVADIYGTESVLDQLPRSVPPVYSREGGVHPDELAQALGYRSGETMLNDVMKLERERRAWREGGDRRSVREKLLDEAADQEMKSRHGDMLNDGSIEEEALAAIHNERAGELLAVELKALAAKSKTQATSLQMAQRWAESFVRDQKVRDLAPHVYLRAELKAAREVEAALAKGDDQEALAAKERQLLNHVLFREAQKAKEASDQVVRRLGRYAVRQTLPSMDQAYLDQIHGLLEDYDFATHSRKEADRRTAFQAFVQARAAEGETVVASDALMETLGRKSYHDMTVEELEGLGDAVESLAHLGRLKKKLLVAKEQRDFDELVGEAQANAAPLKPRKPDTSAVRKGSSPRKLDAALLKVETIADFMDEHAPGGASNGVFNRVLIWGGRDAHAAENEIRRAVSDKLVALHEAVPKETRASWRRAVEAPELIDPTTGQPMELTKANVLAMALNTGNESSLTKLLDGWGWDAGHLKAVLDRTMTKPDWEFVQGVWDTLDTLWPQIAATEKALTGLTPERVERRTVVTPHGEFKGGYYPVVYDPTRSPELDKARAMDASALFNDFFVSVATPKGHTISRTRFTAPVLLSPEAVIFDHINKVAKRIAYGEYVLSAKRFIESGRIRKLVEEKVGPEYYAEMMPWLQRQVGYRLQDPRSLAVVDRFLRGARMNFTTAAAAIRSTVLFEHGAAFGQSAQVIGPKWLARGLARYTATGGPFGSLPSFIYDRSPMMKFRMQEADRDLRDIFDQMHAKPTLLNKARAAAHLPVSWVNQYIVAMPTWLGGYERALKEGMSEEEAGRYADKAVSTSHSSGAPMDLARVQDGGEFQKLFTMFYGYHNAQYQLQRRGVWAAGHGQYGKAASAAFWTLLVAPVVTGLVTGKHPDSLDPGEWAEFFFDHTIRALWEGVPVLRDAANWGFSKVEAELGMKEHGSLDYQPSPIFRALEATGNSAVDVTRMMKQAAGQEGKDPSEKWLQHLIEVVGYWTGLPLGQVATSAQYAKDVAQGNEQPENALQAGEGALFGAKHH